MFTIDTRFSVCRLLDYATVAPFPCPVTQYLCTPVGADVNGLRNCDNVSSTSKTGCCGACTFLQLLFENKRDQLRTWRTTQRKHFPKHPRKHARTAFHSKRAHNRGSGFCASTCVLACMRACAMWSNCAALWREEARGPAHASPPQTSQPPNSPRD